MLGREEEKYSHEVLDLKLFYKGAKIETSLLQYKRSLPAD